MAGFGDVTDRWWLCGLDTERRDGERAAGDLRMILGDPEEDDDDDEVDKPVQANGLALVSENALGLSTFSFFMVIFLKGEATVGRGDLLSGCLCCVK